MDFPIVPILDGNSEMGANVRSNLCFYLFNAFDYTESCQKLAFSSSPNRHILFMRVELLSNMSTMNFLEFPQICRKCLAALSHLIFCSIFRTINIMPLIKSNKLLA